MKDLYLREFEPRPNLTIPITEVIKPRFPVVDSHMHLNELLPGLSFSGGWHRRPVEDMIAVLDEAGVRTVIDFDGGFGERLAREIERYCSPYPERFVVLAGLDYEAFGRVHDIGKHLANQLRDSVAKGARGLKVWKLLGLHLRDKTGSLFPVNDARLIELWETAGELGVPVAIHVGDPVAFFQPFDQFNERFEELSAHPEWHFYGGDFPRFETIITQFADLIISHPHTTFIGVHVGCYAENLDWVGNLLDRCPNFFIDIAGRIPELGRKPYSTRQFLIRYSERILFGTDNPPEVKNYQLHYRFLETGDEYFHYNIDGQPHNGRWMIYGLALPDEVLQRIYYENTRRLFGLAK